MKDFFLQEIKRRVYLIKFSHTSQDNYGRSSLNVQRIILSIPFFIQQYLVKYDDQNEVLSMQLKVSSMFKTWEDTLSMIFLNNKKMQYLWACLVFVVNSGNSFAGYINCPFWLVCYENDKPSLHCLNSFCQSLGPLLLMSVGNKSHVIRTTIY